MPPKKKREQKKASEVHKSPQKKNVRQRNDDESPERRRSPRKKRSPSPKSTSEHEMKKFIYTKKARMALESQYVIKNTNLYEENTLTTTMKRNVPYVADIKLFT
jgi:hypothetical protein